MAEAPPELAGWWTSQIPLDLRADLFLGWPFRLVKKLFTANCSVRSSP